MKPELTIVIPVFNRAGIVGRTLDSVRHQTLRPLAVVLVDNNSTDETLDVLRQWKEHVEGPGFEVTVVSETTPSAAAARNRGLREVTTPYTMFFDSDDIMQPAHARRALDAFHAPDAPDLVGWDVESSLLDRRKHILSFSDSDLLWNNLMHGNLSTQRYAARTELFREAGEWNPEMLGWDDIELGTRILLRSPKVRKIAGKPLVQQISHAVSITGQACSDSCSRWENALDAIETTLRAAGHPVEAVSLRRAVLAGQYIAEGDPEDGLRLMIRTLSDTPSWRKRRLLKFACRYTALGGRGAARILHPFFKI